MIVEADNAWTRVKSATAAEEAWLDGALSFAVAGAEHAQAYQDGFWDGMRHMLVGGKFPSGLVRRVWAAARAAGVRFDLVDVRAPVALPGLSGAWLRDYQRSAVDALLARGRGVLQAPTGSGKTASFAAIVQAVDVTWLVLVDSSDLLAQAADEIARFTGEDVGRCGDGQWETARVTVATFQTILRGGDRSRELLDAASGIVVDETHILGAQEYYRVAMATPNARYRFGVSATPFERADGANYLVEAALGPLVHHITEQSLIASGAIARPTIWMVRHKHKKMRGTFAEVYEAGVVLDDDRNRLVVDIAADDGVCPRPALVFFKAIVHGNRIADALGGLAYHVSTDVVSGKTPSFVRARARRRLMDGDLDVLISSRIFNKGVDLPELASAVNAAAGESDVDTLQRLGRGTRVVAGKSVFRMIDVMDVGNYHLERHAKARVAAYKSRGFDVRIVEAAGLRRAIAEDEIDRDAPRG